MQTQEVYLRVDDADLSKVSVWSLQDKFLCMARANQRLPARADRELLRAAIRQQRQYSKALKNAQPARMRIHEDLPTTMFRLEQERAERLAASRPRTPTPTPTLVPIRSPLEKELPRMKAALEAMKPPTAEQAASRRELNLSMMMAIQHGRERREALELADAGKLNVPSIDDLVGEYAETAEARAEQRQRAREEREELAVRAMRQKRAAENHIDFFTLCMDEDQDEAPAVGPAGGEAA